MEHQHHHHDHSLVKEPGVRSTHKAESSVYKLAFSATLHCLLGCGIGEVTGMIISTAIGLSMFKGIMLSVILGFIAGLALGVVPLIKAKFTFRNALKTVILAEGLSIAVMEAFEVLTQWAIPGVMMANLTDMISGMACWPR